MRALTTESELATARAAFARVVTDNVYGAPFRPHVIHRRLLFPIEDVSELSPAQLAAVTRAATVVGSTGFYVSYIDLPPQAGLWDVVDRRWARHYWIDLDQSGDYLELPAPPWEHVIYGADGVWAVILTLEDFGAAGSTDERFIAELYAGDEFEDLPAFLTFLLEQVNSPIPISPGWILPILRQIEDGDLDVVWSAAGLELPPAD